MLIVHNNTTMQISANSTIYVVKQESRDNELNYYLTEYEFFCPADPILKAREKIYNKYSNFIVNRGDKIANNN
jgi:hypothetical protein